MATVNGWSQKDVCAEQVLYGITTHPPGSLNSQLLCVGAKEDTETDP